MKYCPRCKQEKTTEAFGKHSRKKDGLQPYCRECKSEIDAQHYQENKGAQIARVRKLGKDRQAKVNEIKATSGCVLCHEGDPCCLEFHHLDPAQKDLEISVALRRWSWAKIVSEIEKCVVLCSNCHKKVHAGRNGPVAQLAEQDSLKVEVQGSTPCGTT